MGETDRSPRSRTSRGSFATRAFVFAAVTGFALIPHTAAAHEVGLPASLNATTEPLAAKASNLHTPATRVQTRAGTSNARAPRAVQRQGPPSARQQSARFAARINAAARRHAQRAKRAHARNARWVAHAVADLHARDVRRFDRLAREASSRHAVPVDLIRAVILVESRYKAQAVSPAGAVGLMQLMPATAAELQVGDPFDARQNVFGGARLLRILGDNFTDPTHVIAAYNAGSGAVRKYGGVPPYRETQKYVGRVLRAYQHYRAQRLRTVRSSVATSLPTVRTATRS